MSKFRENPQIHDLLLDYPVEEWTELPLHVQFMIAKLSGCEFSFETAVESLPPAYLDLLTIRMAEEFDFDAMYDLHRTVQSKLKNDLKTPATRDFIEEEFRAWQEIVAVETQEAEAHDRLCGQWA